MIHISLEQLSSYVSLINERFERYLSGAVERTQGYLSATWSHVPAIVPYLPLIVTTAAALVCLMLFMSMKVQLRSIQARLRTFEETANQSGPVEEPAAAGREEKAEIPPVEGDRLTLVNLPRAGLDKTVRSKVLRMHRAGQPTGDIAANLRMPKGEVDLLVKVHEIELGTLEEPASA